HLRILERKVMNDTADVLTTVREAFKSAFDVDPRLVSVETSPSDIPGWDSVGHPSLASELEQAFGISLDVDELIEMESVREIVRIITPKLSKEVSGDSHCRMEFCRAIGKALGTVFVLNRGRFARGNCRG